jgi:hypothetical protein
LRREKDGVWAALAWLQILAVKVTAATDFWFTFTSVLGQDSRIPDALTGILRNRILAPINPDPKSLQFEKYSNKSVLCYF